MGQWNNSRAKAHRAMESMCTPDLVIADATTAQPVGFGNVCRIEATAGGFIKFGDALVEVPSGTTANTMKTAAGFITVVASGEYIRTSAAMRIEVIKD